MRVVFGAGRVAELPAEAERLGLERLVVLATPGRAEEVKLVSALLGHRVAGRFEDARPHVPASVVQAACEAAGRLGADGCVAIGGGSVIGLGKAAARQTGLPVIAIPTTYSGSEMTPIWGITEDGVKRTGRDLRVLPRSVVYDPELTVRLPPRVSGLSGLNALAHAMEALYAPDATPVTALMAEEGVRALAAALPVLVDEPSDLPARTLALHGSWLCGLCLGQTTMSLHHKLCHVLGGTFDLPHAEAHSILMPYVAAFNLPAAPAADAAMSRALGVSEAAPELARLGALAGAAPSLGELGLSEGDLDEVVRQVFSQPYANPRRLRPEEVRGLLLAALKGTLASG
ncbi:maleylacetate reductase [Amycolatopsis rhabdoformis]|uniref:Maleylacetate reductase n=1 Tax=Amycolatopsis rhabdoformis TaxID=1448059 RepID=A0ABZ1I8U9_9PSEU|nr:maleylacetate reductase [Amycolatopsis rhabdoformis]WSE29974.1 maleylacetate reductase [Amycolatopsis rhabdoformis]